VSGHRPAVKRSQGFLLRCAIGDGAAVLGSGWVTVAGSATSAGRSPVGWGSAVWKGVPWADAAPAWSEPCPGSAVRDPAVTPLAAGGPLMVAAIRLLSRPAAMRPLWPPRRGGECGRSSRMVNFRPVLLVGELEMAFELAIRGRASADQLYLTRI